MTPIDQLNRDLDAAIQVRLQAEYKRGLADGLGVAKKIRSWLTRHPDHRWQKQVREWADREIGKTGGERL